MRMRANGHSVHINRPLINSSWVQGGAFRTALLYEYDCSWESYVYCVLVCAMTPALRA